MGKPILLLRLEGPLQSWGNRARWDVRDTGTSPTKSGIVGLLGCALGYPIYDHRLETELDAGLRFGVRTESPGRVICDFQTVTDFLPTADGNYKYNGVKRAASLTKLRSMPDASPSTIVSPRYYLEDASFLVALEEAEEGIGLLKKCADALQHPSWPIFLGRKSCVPTRPVFEMLTGRYDSIEIALLQHPVSWLGDCLAEREAVIPHTREAFVEDALGIIVCQDAVRTNAARQYGFRNARRLKLVDRTEHWR